MRTKDRIGDMEVNLFLLPSAVNDGTSRIAEILKIDEKMAEFEAKFAEEASKFSSQNQGAAKLELMRRKKRQELFAEAEKTKSTDSDAEILWKINFNILDRIYRDRLLLEILINDVGIDDIGEKIMRAAFGFCLKLQDGNASQPCAKFFSRKDLEVVLRDNADITADDYEATLYLVSSSADRFIRKVGEGSGGLYTIDYVDGMRMLLTKDTSYEFNPMSSQFLYGVDLLKVNLNQFQKVLQYQSNYINRRLKEKEEIIAVKSVKNKVRKMIDYAKQNITDDSELADTIEDVSNEFDQGKRMKLRRYRQFRDYLKKVEMMLNETIWILHRNCEMEQRKRKEEGGNDIKRSKKRAADAQNSGLEAKRARY
uniref:Uncharacterized protein n=1 Tax=Panagrolaimus superbus TaxID=310955 RepID=A0A914Z8E2_9BILA